MLVFKCCTSERLSIQIFRYFGAILGYFESLEVFRCWASECFSIQIFGDFGTLVQFLDISGVWKCKCLNIGRLNV